MKYHLWLNFSEIPFVPESCCAPDANLDKCQGKAFPNGPPSMPYIEGTPLNNHLYTDVSMRTNNSLW